MPTDTPASDTVKYVRLSVGRWIVHLGLAVMPNGRVKEELVELLVKWRAHVFNELGMEHDPYA